jgi:hypothetical protein
MAATVDQAWQALSPARGNAPSLGFVINGSSSELAPTSASINGAPCTIVRR